MDQMGEMLGRLRAQKPPCRVCEQPCDPDSELMPVTLILVPMDAIGDQQGIIPVHQGRCHDEAMARLKAGQAAVEERKRRQGTEAPYDRAQRLLGSGEATQLDA